MWALFLVKGGEKMKYNVLKFVTNTKGEYQVAVVSTSSNIKGARTSFLSTSTALSNASDVLYAVTKIVDEYGNDDASFRITIDNRPEPEPENNTEATLENKPE